MREVVQEEISSATKLAKEEIKSTAAKAKGKAKTKTELDYTRKAGMDLRDPRAKDQQWPCLGSHHPQSHGNRFGSWTVRMQHLRTSSELHPGNECTGPNDPCGFAAECDTGLGTTSYRRLGTTANLSHTGQGHDYDRCQGVPASENPEVQEGLQAERSPAGTVSRLRNDHEAGGLPDPLGLRLREGRHGLGRKEEEGEGHWKSAVTSADDDDHQPQSEATRQNLVRSTTEFNTGTCLGALQDYTNPSLVWEVCCRADSALMNAVHKQKLQGHRKTLETGYDIGKPTDVSRMIQEAKELCPSIAWFNLVCTAVTSIQNLNQRDWKQVDNLRKKRQRCRRQLRGAIAIIWAIIIHHG